MTLGQYIADSIILDEIKRSDMPQVKGKNILEMLSIFRKYGIPFDVIETRVDMLKPIQEDAKQEKIDAISNDIKNGKQMHPIIISKDLYIIDGHHRWLAYKKLNKIGIEAIQIGYNKTPALELYNKVEYVVSEATTNNIKKVIAVFSGRFQPAHSGHYALYKKLVDEFGSNNTYIATSDVTNSENSPLNFNEKVKIFTTLFNVPKSKIVKIKNPYNPTEILSKYDENTTAFVVGVSSKDASRLGGKYYTQYKNKNNLQPYKSKGYYYIFPAIKTNLFGKNVPLSATSIRNGFSKELFKQIYPKYDDGIYKLLSKKLNVTEEKILDFVSTYNIKKIIKENSGNFNVGNISDDGPLSFYGNYLTFKKISRKRARDVGWSIVNYLLGTKEDFYHHPSYPEDGPVDSVSFFPAGVPGKLTPLNQVDSTGTDAYNKWLKHVDKITTALGWVYLNYLDSDISIKSSKFEPNEIKESIITEGGAAGHMSNIWEDWDLSFNDLYTLVDAALEGKLESVTEKLDGQNLMFSWIDGKLRAARNAGHIKNFGKSSLDISGIKNMFSGRGDIETAFVEAIRDLEKAVKGLSQKQKDKIFKNGKKFMNVEIIYPQTANVIPYGLSLLSFHGTVEYNENGDPINSSQEDARILAGMIKQINSNVQKTFKIDSTHGISIPKAQDFSKQKSYFNNKIKSLQSKFKLKNSDKVEKYHQLWWKDFIESQAKTFKYNIPDKILSSLVRRWAFSDKSEKIVDLRKQIENDDFLNWMNSFDKKDHSNQQKINIQPFENIFLELGSRILLNIKSFLAANPDKAVQKIKSDIDNTIKQLKSSSDIPKLEAQLKRLETAGGMDAIVPSEGITFVYNNKLYKFTGTFAPINHLLGILKFGGR